MPSPLDDEALILAVLERDDLPDTSRAAFEDIQQKLERYPLTKKQREWAQAVLHGEPYESPVEYENLMSSGRAPRGREVPTPAVLQNLPKRPPPRKVED